MVLSDESLYDSPNGPGVFYVPRWRVVEPSGGLPQITLQQSATSWTMTVRLEPYAAPAVAGRAAQAQALASSDDVVLRYTLVAAAGSGQSAMVQEVHPSSIVADGGQRVVTFSGTDNADLDRLYGAMTDESHGTVLVVRRTVTAAVVAPGATGPPIWSRAPIEAFPARLGPVTDLFQAGLVQRVALLPQPGLGGDPGPVIGRPVLADPVILPRPPLPLPLPGPTPPDQQRYWVRTAVLEDPSSFYYPADRYPSIYAGITTGTPTYARTRRYVSFNGLPFPYYQDPGEAATFYYLPDSFRLARTADSPHMLMLQIDPQGVGGPMDEITVSFGFVAMPYVSAERIAAAVEQLRAFAPGPYPPGVTGPLLQPLLVMPDALSLRLFTGDAAPSAAGAVLSLRTGVTGQLTLTLSEFRAAYNALFAGLALLTGNVVVDLGGTIDTETVPIALRAGTTWGPVLDAADQPAGGASVQVTLTNATESPVRIGAVAGFLWRDGPGQPAGIPEPVSGAPAAPSSAPADVSADGQLGPETTTALQQGLAANGWYPASAVDGVFGASTAVGIQQWTGVAADGDMGPQTVRALQAKVGATVNGVWESVTRPHTAHADVFSGTTLALQVALNAGILSARASTSPLTLPVTVTAGDHLVLTVAAPGDLPGPGTLRGRVDASLTELPDPQSVWDSVFSHSVPALTQHTVLVRVTSDIFAARTAPSPRPALKAVTVAFGAGTVVTFDVSDIPAGGASPFITKPATLPVSLRDYVLAAGGARPYTYRVSALTADDQTVADAVDRSGQDDTLDISLPAFPVPG